MILQKDLAEVSLYEFFKQSWKILEGDLEFQDEWYLEVLADHLEQVFYRKIKRLLINIPPRTGKTSLISVAFPAWCWIHDPAEKFLCASCSNNLALEIADKSRTILESYWFKKNWCDRFTLRRDQNAKGYFSNNKTGYRISTSTGSHVVGRGGSIQITDDPNSAGDTSQKSLIAAQNWWTMKWFNRLNDLKNDARILVQQRVDEQDISGFVIKHDIDNQWTKLVLPFEFEPDLTQKDRRTTKGEILTKRVSQKELKQIKTTLGSYEYSAQYQQKPISLKNGILKKQWFKLYPTTRIPKLEFIIQSWDTALTTKDTSSYSAATTWGIFLDENTQPKVILLSAFREKLEYPDLRRRIIRMSKNYLDTGVSLSNNSLLHNQPDRILIEAKASGNPLIQDLYREGVYTTPFQPQGDKMQRVKIISALIESGVVYLPCCPVNRDKFTEFAEEFLMSIIRFPAMDALDYADTMSQAFIHLKSGGYFQYN